MRKDFLKLTPPNEFSGILSKYDKKVGAEIISTDDALGRIPTGDIPSPINLPDFRRSTVDGFAVLSSDTHGASSSIPVYLDLVEEIPVGVVSTRKISSGEAARVVTGGMIPDGADAAVMLEYTDVIDNTTLEVKRGAGNLENVVLEGEDIKKGDPVVRGKNPLRPFDIGALLGVGITEIEVYKRPRIAIFSTGDEVVEPKETPSPGQIRDINKYAIAKGVEEAGGIPILLDNVKDDLGTLKGTLNKAIGSADVVILSGGSSVGNMDYTLSAIDEIADSGVMVHGISIKPGKPTIFGVAGGVPIFGLPGHPVGAMVVFLLFVAPFIKKIGGCEKTSPFGSKIRARINRRIPGSPGKDSYIPVILKYNDEDTDLDEMPEATPILGKSGMISILTKSNGLIKIPSLKEGLGAGDIVDVFLFSML